MSAHMVAVRRLALQLYFRSHQRNFGRNDFHRCLSNAESHRNYRDLDNSKLHGNVVAEKPDERHSLTPGDRSADFSEADDFFGVDENLKTSVPVEQLTCLNSDDEIHRKSERAKTNRRPQPRRKERVLGVSFGYLRRDSDNAAKLRTHAKLSNLSKLAFGESFGPAEKQFENPDYISKLLSPEDANPLTLNYISSDSNRLSKRIENTRESFEKKENQVQVDTFFDDQYFEALSEDGVLDSDSRSRYKKETRIDYHNGNEGVGSKQIEMHRTLFERRESERDLNFVDQNYFGEVLNGDKESVAKYETTFDGGDNLKSPVSSKNSTKRDFVTQDDLNFFDDQYFGDGISKPENEYSYSTDVLKPHSENSEMKFSSNLALEKKVRTSVLDSQRKYETSTRTKNNTEKMSNTVIKQQSKNKSSDLKTDDVVIDKETRLSRKRSQGLKPNLEQPETAFDMAMKYRLDNFEKLQKPSAEGTDGVSMSSSGKVDSHGYRILRDQVPDWSHLPREVLAKVLRDCIIYDKHDIVVIDKPYGLASHGGPGVVNSIGQLTPILAQLLDKTRNLEKLHLVHRLDKETTGVMILARTGEMAWRLRELFRKREVVKKYWMITKGVPNPSEGIIDIPMRETTGRSVFKMCLHPEPEDGKGLVTKGSRLKAQSAVTHYRVLDSQSQAALVEAQPQTGVKHQLRAHLSLGLNTPILGDHKYSHFNKLAPQRLHPEILTRLGIRQSKVRHLAMHLHAKLLVLPEFIDGRNLVLSARLPQHFVTNMRRLKLKPPS